MERQYDIRMSIDQIRAAIDLEKDGWVNYSTTNCYAYALGLDIPEGAVGYYAYSPGVIGSSEIFLPKFRTFSYHNLIENMYLDFEALGIDYREIDPMEQISDDEWKIALFLLYYHRQVEDFHFLRERRDGLWYHKSGWTSSIKAVDDYGQKITNPEYCRLRSRTYDKTLALKLKKH